MKAQRGIEVILYSFLNLDLNGCGSKSKASAALTPGMNRYPLYRRLGRVQSQSRHSTLLYDMNVRHETIIIFGHIPEDTDNHRNTPKQPQQSASCRTQQPRLLQSHFDTCCVHKLPQIHT